MKRRLKETYEAQPAPSARLARSVMAQVAADRREGSDRTSTPSSWPHGMDQWFHAYQQSAPSFTGGARAQATSAR
jgi:hypothetical protein